MSASPPGQRPSIDWGIGNYESTAAKLVAAARLVLDRAEPLAGASLVDVGCGTGNAALIAAERGARVTGVDPAARLLEVARREAAERGLDVSFVPGDAANLPLADGAAGIVVSVFGVIFAPDAQAAAAELARVTAPEGRIVLSAWVPEGAIARTTREFRQTIARALGTPPAPPPFAWHDPAALAELLDPHGFEVQTEEASLSFGARSARAFLEDEMRDHPASVAGRAVLEPRGEMDALRERSLGILEEANEDPEAFRVTSRYVIALATRRGRPREKWPSDSAPDRVNAWKSKPGDGRAMAKDHGSSVKNDKQYEGLRKKGMSKSRAAAISNSPGSSSRGGKKSSS